MCAPRGRDALRTHAATPEGSANGTAPDLQEKALFMKPGLHGRDPVSERHLRYVAAPPEWDE